MDRRTLVSIVDETLAELPEWVNDQVDNLIVVGTDDGQIMAFGAAPKTK